MNRDDFRADLGCAIVAHLFWLLVLGVFLRQ